VAAAPILLAVAVALGACSSKDAAQGATATASAQAKPSASVAAASAAPTVKPPPPPPKLAIGVEVVGMTKELYERRKIDGFEDGKPTSRGTPFDPDMIAYPGVAADTVQKDEVLVCNAPREVQAADDWVPCYGMGADGDKIRVRVENLEKDVLVETTLDGEHVARPQPGLRKEFGERLATLAKR
jgi:hypothetical protein